ncbi:MAG: hypothetical protein LUH14_08175 [Clostridiaceae bacterium]|nr:hypothetical protein [Clostridiaceae bacterium]
MITQKQMKLWIPEAQEIFKRYMSVDTLPGGTLPPIYIGAPRNILSLRAELVEKTKSHQVNTPDPYDSIMEMIHGDAGDAILIQQKLVPGGNMAQINFNHALWHEFGHYFAIYNESDIKDEYGASALHHYCDQNNLAGDEEFSVERDKQQGYWFWSEFIAECIANYVDEQHCRIDNAEAYHPERLVWTQNLWEYCFDQLAYMLDTALSAYPNTVDDAALALYFASLLTKDVMKRFVKAAENGELLEYDYTQGKAGATKPLEEKIDSTCITETPDAFQDTLWDIKAVLERQLKKEEFWKVDAHFLDEVGGYIGLLSMDKMLLKFTGSGE